MLEIETETRTTTRDVQKSVSCKNKALKETKFDHNGKNGKVVRADCKDKDTKVGSMSDNHGCQTFLR